MSFSLGFSPEFFLADGEPFDRSDLALNKNKQPISVWSAIELMRQDDPKQWKELTDFLCGKDAILTAETVFELIEETNTCTDLDIESPIEVWIDPQGNFRIKVYSDCN